MCLPKLSRCRTLSPLLAVLAIGCVFAVWGRTEGRGQGQEPVPLGRPIEAPAVPDQLPGSADAPPAPDVPIFVEGAVPPPHHPILFDPNLKLPPDPPVQVDSSYLPPPIMTRPVEDMPQLPTFVGKPAVSEKSASYKDPTLRQSSEGEQFIHPEMGIDLIVGIPRLVILRDRLERMQIGGGDEHNCPVTVVEMPNHCELTLLGRRVGRTVLNLWFIDPAVVGGQRVISYVIRVLPDTEHYQEQQKLINETFPRSRVELKIVGPNLLVTGLARNAQEAAHIMHILQPEHAAMHERTSQADDYGHAPPLRIVNLLHVMPERQVMLRVMVTEVDRSMVQGLGLAEGGQATLLDSAALHRALDGIRSMNMGRTLYDGTLVASNGQAVQAHNGPASGGSAFHPADVESLGLSMTLMPSIADRGQIALNLEGEVAVSGSPAGRRSLQTVAVLYEGQTLALGGVRRVVHSLARSGPGRLPVVGGVFHREQTVAREHELIVTITPELVRQNVVVGYRPAIRDR